MNNWKKRWKEELNAHIPSLSDEVRQLNINSSKVHSENVVAENVVPEEAHNPVLRHRKRTLIATLASCMAVVASAVVIIPFALKSNNVPIVKSATVMVEINPSVVFSTDDNGIVTSVVSANPDGDVILSTDSTVNSLKGENIEHAVVQFIDYSARAGYLNLENSKAIRISACEKNKDAILPEVGNSARKYFKEKGSFAVVVEDSIPVENFCKRMGTDSLSTLEQLQNKLSGSVTGFSERTKNWQNCYDDIIPETEVVETISFNIDKIIAEKNREVESLQNISSENNQIKNHSENILHRTYWDWKIASLGKPTSESFLLLMDEMDSLIKSHQENFGDKITSTLDMELSANKAQHAINLYTSIKELGELTVEKIKNSTIIKEFLQFGKNVIDNVTEWFDTPATFEDFSTRVSDYFGLRQERYSKDYNKILEKVSDDEYNNNIKNIEEKYGSLDKYWDYLKNF